MAKEHGDEYLEALSVFTDERAEGLLDGSTVLKLKPLGLLYLDSRFGALSELDALRADAPVDYLRAVVADLGDYRKLEKLQGFLRMLEKVKVAGANAPLRDSVPLRLSMLSGLRHLELHGCDLSTAAAQGLLELKPQLETLVCVDSTDSLADLLADRGAPLTLQTPWSRLTRLACPLNHLRLMDPSLCSLPVADEIDLSRNQLTTVANLHNCVRLTKLDLGFNSIASLVGLNRVVGAITQLILRGNGIHSLAGLEKLYAIEALDLAHNVIGSLSEVARLGRLPSLTRLWLEGNPIELRRKYRAEVLGLLQDGEKVELDGRQSSTFERFAIRSQRRRNARAPRFPEPVYPTGTYVAAVQSATSEEEEAHARVHKSRPTRIAEPEIVEEAPDEDPRSPPKTACIMEHPEEDPERMFSVRALKHSPPTRVKSPLAEEASPPEATTSSAEEEPVSDSGLEDSENRPPVLVKTPGSGFAEGFHTSVRIAEEGPSGGSTPRSVNRLPSPVADAETPEREAAECFHTVGSMSEDEVSSSSTTASENGDPLRGAESPASSREKEEGIHTASLRGAERSSEDSVKGVHNGVGSGSESKRERDPSDFGSESKLRSSDSRDEHVLRTAGKALGPNGDQLSDSCRPGGYRSGCSESTGQEQATEVSALQFEESSHIGTALLDEQSPDMGEERGRKKWVSDAGKSEPRRTGEGQETSAGCGELEGLCSSVAEASDLCQQGNLPVSSGEPVVEEGTDESEPRQTQEGNKPGTEDGRGQLVQLRVSGLEASGLCRAGGSSGKTAVEMGTDESKCLGTQTENTVDFEENIGLLAKREGAAGKGSLESSDCVTERDPTLRSEQPPTKSAVKEQPKPHDSPVVHSYQQGKLGSGLLTESRNQEASDSASEISVKMSKLGKEAKKKRKARVVDLGP